MKLNFIKKTLLLLTLSLAIVSCDDLETNDQTGHSISVDTNPAVTVSLDFANPLVFVEAAGDMTYDYTVTLSEVQIVDIKLYIKQIGGTADDYDYSMTDLIIIPAGYTSGSGSITLLYDEEIEGDETLTIEIGDQRTTNAQFSPVTVDITIVDYVFCFWVLEATDTYGDGWNGASIDLTSEGTTTSYYNDDPDGTIGSETVTLNIAVTDGADYSFEFLSGDWDSEIVYTLTAPDGTVYADGPSPTVGVITSGTQDCP
ncbi:MAG: hypothetical protein COA67_01950 [Lutibacter sp.]|nr:MAG: hypothetical protein COA67_01950 [Lutibacter sp.]